MKQILKIGALAILAIILTTSWTPIDGKCAPAEEPTYLDLYYVLTPRFEPISKSTVQEATTVADFFDERQLQPLTNYKSVEVIVVENDVRTDKRATNSYYMLSKEQQNMLNQLDYSEHFILRLGYQALNDETGNVEYMNSEPHFTVVPETQASYSLGEKAFIDYVNEANRENTANLKEDDLGFAKLAFTVNEDGSLSDFELDRSTGSTKIDNAMSKIVMDAPGDWEPARNDKGETVKQQLVLTIGSGGC